MRFAEPIETHKIYTVDSGKQVQNRESNNRLSAPRDKADGIKPRLHVTGDGNPTSKKTLFELDRNTKRKRESVDDHPNKRVIL
jgi:hypothetical protein